MLSPFNLKRYLSANSNADPEDVLNVKTALKQFGNYKTPKYGMTQYPDQPMFDGVKKYQSENSLRKDAVMKPGGETERSMNGRLKQADNRRMTPDENLGKWKIEEGARIRKEIKRLRYSIGEKRTKLQGETDPNSRAAIHVLIKNLEQKLRELQQELQRVPGTKTA